MKGDMEIETIMKIVIGLIVVFVIIGFILMVKHGVVAKLGEMFKREEPDVFTLDLGHITVSDIERYGAMCTQKASHEPDKQMTCYLMKGSVDSDVLSYTGNYIVKCTADHGFLMVRYIPLKGVVFEC